MEREVLPRPVNYIGSQTWGDPFVAPDESYMLIKAIREEGYGGNDIYIAYRKTDGTWTNPKNLGPVINTPYDETSGDITPDGLYMTYGSNDDLYWVGTGFIDSLKYTNYLPYVKNPIPDQEAWVGEFFSFIVPDSAFFDDDGYSTLNFSAMLASGSPLPAWLSFDPITCKFEGTPTETGILNIRVSATDTAGETCSDIFKLVISPATGLDPGAEVAVTVYPNPSSGIFRFRRGDLPLGPAKVEVYDLCGKMVLCAELQPDGILDLTGRMKGMYILRLYPGSVVISRKICLE
jgi:hypothetical protein